MSEVMTGILEGAGFTAAGDNRFKFKATKVGAKAKNKDGVEKVWSAAMLSAMHPTWKDKPVSINHNGSNYGKIVDTEYDGTFVYHTIDVQPWLAGWIRRNPNHIGISIESTGKWNDAGEIIEAAGTGVTIVLPPYVPVCSLEEGCGYFAGATDKSLTTADETAEKGERMSNEKTEDMIAAEVALKAEIKALNDKLVAASEEKKTIEAELNELRAFKAKVDDKERGELLAALTGYLGDVDAYKSEHICVLRKMVSSCEAAVKKFEAAKLQTSGADVKNTENKKTEEEFPGYSAEEIAEYKAAAKIAESVGMKL